ncbi:MAG: prepilin-type N-terminal cleavage/methylation domain-containing protein [Desulfovermiculus sp.]
MGSCEPAQNGFTLLEVLISLTIVALAVTVYFQLISAGMKLEHKSGEKIKLAVQAQQFFERLQCQDVREDGFQWQGEDKTCQWKLELKPEDVQVSEWDEDEIQVDKNTELYTYILTYDCPNEQPMIFRRMAVVDPDFFSDQFKDEYVKAE